MIDALSQAEADRVFPPADRAAAAMRLQRQAATIRQRLNRNLKKSAEAWGSWNAPTGSPLDLIDYETFAERAQLCVGQLAGIEAQIRSVQR